MEAAEAQFTDLYGTHYRQVLGYLLRRTDSTATAQDLAEDVFLVAWRKLDGIPPGKEAEFWLYGVARNTLASYTRKTQNRRRIRRQLPFQSPQSGPLPEEVVVRNEEAQALADAFGGLRERDRELIRLAYWEELPHDAIAALLDVSRGTVDVRLHRAIKRLAKELDRLSHVQIEGLLRGVPKESEC